MRNFDSLEDLMGSLHLFSKEQLKELAGQIEDILSKHKEALSPKEENTELTPLDEFEFANDMSAFAALANDLDKRGFCEAADEIDELLKKTAVKKKEPGRSFAKWMRQLKKMQAPQKIIDKFRKSYKVALEQAKKRKNHNANKAEEYAVRTAVGGLPKKYLKEPSKFHSFEKCKPTQKAEDADLMTAYQQIGLDINKLKKLTPQQLKHIIRTRNPGLARQLAEQYFRESTTQRPTSGSQSTSQPVQPVRQPTQGDFPPEATERDFPSAATKEELFGRRK